MCGFNEPSPYPVRSFTHHTEQDRANQVQRLIVYNTLQTMVIDACNFFKTVIFLGDEVFY
jgi:hypothetical protein